MAYACCLERGERTYDAHEKVEVEVRHEGYVDRDTEEASLEVDYPDVVGMDGMGLEEGGEVVEGFIGTAEDMDLGEEVLATDVEPVTADEGACCKGVLAVAAEVVEDVAK